VAAQELVLVVADDRGQGRVMVCPGLIVYVPTTVTGSPLLMLPLQRPVTFQACMLPPLVVSTPVALS